jgi:hypothetical protein
LGGPRPTQTPKSFLFFFGGSAFDRLQQIIQARGIGLAMLNTLAGHHHHHQAAETQNTTQASSGSSDGINVSLLQQLQSILSQYDLSSLSSDQNRQLTSQLQNSGLMTTGNVINLSA